MARLARLTEQGFIDRIARLARPRGPRPRGLVTVLGIGDDAAVLVSAGRLHTLLTTDFLTEGIHFRAAWAPGVLLGRKALAASLSDIAAMGGVPSSFVLSAGFPRRTDATYALQVARGIAAQARRFGVSLVGGDTCAARSLFLNVALLGLVEPGREVRRSGARSGDGLYVTGRLGAPAAGLQLLKAGARHGRASGARAAAIRAHLDPEPRVIAGRLLGLTGLAAAMIDLSDGLARDLLRLCAASGAGAFIEACTGGRAEGPHRIGRGSRGNRARGPPRAWREGGARLLLQGRVLRGKLPDHRQGDR